MGIWDRSAFPEDLNEQHEVDANFKDDDQFGTNWFGRLWRWWNKKTKHWDAFGPRSPKGIAFSMWPPFILARQWRDVPKVLWAEKLDGYWRFEKDGEPDKWSAVSDPQDFLKDNPGYYLSRNQLWCRRHRALSWPIFFSSHRYEHSDDVIPVGHRADRDGKLWFFYLGAKRDSERLFWWIAFFAGKNFK